MIRVITTLSFRALCVLTICTPLVIAQEEVSEWQQAYNHAAKYLSDSNLDSALTAGRNALSMAQEEFGGRHVEVANCF